MNQNTGQYYATSKRAYLSSTFNEQIYAALIGSKISGTISKQASEPFEYLVKETGETIMLNHRWIYVPEALEELQNQQNSKDALFVSVDSFKKTRAFEH